MGTNSNKLEQTSPFILNTALAAAANRFRCSKKKYAGYKAGAGVDMLQNNITRFREFTRFRV